MAKKPLTRRQFLHAGLATTAALAGGGTLVGFAGCGSGSSSSSPATVTDTYQLTVGYLQQTLAGLTVNIRTYNGSIPAPLLRTAPGHRLKITVVNQLPPNPPATPPPGIDPMNNPHKFNSTNLHVHGLQVVPHIFDPVGTLNPDADMISIEPGTSFTYEFYLPENHPSGFYWYHPHLHGSTGVQV